MQRRTVLLSLCGLAVLGASGVQAQTPQSGPAPGSHTPPFHPKHVAGPDRGSATCPV